MKQIEKIIYSRLHNVDHDKEEVSEKELSTDDSKNYIRMVIGDLLVMKNTKSFSIRSNTTEVISILVREIPTYLNEAAATSEEINGTTICGYSKAIAERLLAKEVEAKEKYEENLKIKIKNGSLLNALVETEDGYSYILAKIEHKPFIDREDSIKHYGLPFENNTLKGCIINLNEEYGIIDIRISDTGSTIAKYWSDDFLEFDEINDNERNTNRAITEINRVLNKFVKSVSEQDSVHLKQRLLGYFDTNKSYKHTEMISALFDNFTPKAEGIDIDAIKEKLEKLPEEKNFDATFEIDPKSVDKKSKQQFEISDDISLNLKRDIPNISDRIKADIEEGIRLLKIYNINEDTYNTFKD